MCLDNTHAVAEARHILSSVERRLKENAQKEQSKHFLA